MLPLDGDVDVAPGVVVPGLVWSLGVTPDSLPGVALGLVWSLGVASCDPVLPVTPDSPGVALGLVWSLGVTPDSLPGVALGLPSSLGAAPGVVTVLLPGPELVWAKTCPPPKIIKMPSTEQIIMLFFILYLQLLFLMISL